MAKQLVVISPPGRRIALTAASELHSTKAGAADDGYTHAIIEPSGSAAAKKGKYRGKGTIQTFVHSIVFAEGLPPDIADPDRASEVEEVPGGVLTSEHIAGYLQREDGRVIVKLP
jgi:hypothetical protein